VSKLGALNLKPKFDGEDKESGRSTIQEY
jgi:hypothetical protein